MERTMEIDGYEERRALLAAIPDLMFRLRRDGTYLEFAGDISGFATPPETLVGSAVQEILPDDVATALLAAVGEALRTEAPAATQYDLRRLADGQLRRVEARGVPAPGRVDEVVAIVRDVTDELQQAQQHDALRPEGTLVASGAGEVEIVSAIAAELGGLFDADSFSALRWDGQALHVIAAWRRDGRAVAGGRVYAYG